MRIRIIIMVSFSSENYSTGCFSQHNAQMLKLSKSFFHLCCKSPMRLIGRDVWKSLQDSTSIFIWLWEMLLFPDLINLKLKTIKKLIWQAEEEVRMPLNFSFFILYFKKWTHMQLSLVCLASLLPFPFPLPPSPIPFPLPPSPFPFSLSLL